MSVRSWFVKWFTATKSSPHQNAYRSRKTRLAKRLLNMELLEDRVVPTSLVGLPSAVGGGPYSGVTNTSLTLDASNSTGSGGITITAYQWDFGDGAGYTETAINAPDGSFDGLTTHAYMVPGPYNGTLTVTDVADRTGQANFIVNVAPPAPAAPTLDSASDSGALGDGITTVTNPQIDGTAYPNSTVTLYDSSSGSPVSIGTASVNSTGNWSQSVNLSIGTHPITVTSTLGGSTSPASAALQLNIQGTLTYVVPAGSALTVQISGGQVQLVPTGGGAPLAQQALGSTTGISITGANGVANTLTVDLSNAALSLPLTFNGGTGPGSFNTLNVKDSTGSHHYSSGNVTFTGADADGKNGSINIDGTVINFNHLQPVLIGTGTNDLSFTLPSGTVSAVLRDDGNLGNGIAEIFSPNGDFETTDFAVPTTSLTINAGGGTDTITVASGFSGDGTPTGTGDFNSALTINGTAATDTVNVNAPLTLGNGGTNTGAVSITGQVINVSAVIDTTTGSAGNVSLIASQNILIDPTLIMPKGGITTSTGNIDVEANQQSDSEHRCLCGRPHQWCHRPGNWSRNHHREGPWRQ